MKKLFIICTALIICSNLAMILFFNNIDGIFSNLFTIMITVVVYPMLSWAVEHEQVFSIRLELLGLFCLAILSLVRLLNRIIPLPFLVNFIVVATALGMGTFFIIVTVNRLKNRTDWQYKH